MSQKRFVVIGAGTLGRGLSQALATAGNEVLIIDESAELTKLALNGIDRAIDEEISRWGLTPGDKRAIQTRLSVSTNIAEAAESSVVFEAISENLEQKVALFKQLDRICPETTPLITTTAALSVTEIAGTIQHPARLVGMHFLPPVHKTPVVEIIPGVRTSEEVRKFALRMAVMLEKTSLVILDYPGHITTRIVLPMINEAIRVLEEGIADCEQIDTAMKLGFGFNMGPLTLADIMGLDTIIIWMEQLRKETGEAAYIPAKFLRRIVRAGFIGRKSGRGFYRYDKDGRRIEKSAITPTGFSQ